MAAGVVANGASVVEVVASVVGASVVETESSEFCVSRYRKF